MNDLKKLQALSKDFSVLYVEDNESLRANAERLLLKFFHMVTVAEDGEEGLEEFKKHNYPIVITDIKMPKMDGIALTKQIKKIAPRTHVIVMSAFDDKEYLLELIEYGIFKFLKKPVNLEALTSILYATVLKIKEDNATKIINNEESTQDTITEVKKDENLENISLLFAILTSLKEKNTKIELHNYYKGLSITNDADIIEVRKNSVIIKTTFMQEKAIQQEGTTFVVSESLPYVVECSEIDIVSYERQTVELKHLKFIKTSPIQRDSIRLSPEGEYTASLFLHEMRISEDIEIVDISLNSIRLGLKSLPAGLKNCEDINLEISLDNGAFLLSTSATLLKIEETAEKFYIVFVYEILQKAKFMKYITKRQMAIIREFKGMHNG